MSLSQTNIIARLNGAFTGQQQEVLTKLFVDIQSDAAATAAALNAVVAKLNLDAGVTDTNYAAVTLPTTGI
jgi:hypothetical protein